MMVLDNAHEIGDVVYLRTDPDQKARVVTGMMVRPTAIIYYLACGTGESTHYDIEITTDRDVLKATTD